MLAIKERRKRVGRKGERRKVISKAKGEREWAQRVCERRGERKRQRQRQSTVSVVGVGRGERKGRRRRPWLPPRRGLYLPRRSMGSQGKSVYGWAPKESRIAKIEQSAWLVRRESTVSRRGQWASERERIVETDKEWRQEVRARLRGEGLEKGEEHTETRVNERGKVGVPGKGLGSIGEKRGRFAARSRGPVSVTALRHWGKEQTVWGRSEWRVRRTRTEERRIRRGKREKGKGRVWSEREQRERCDDLKRVDVQDKGGEDLRVPREVRGIYSNVRVQRSQEVSKDNTEGKRNFALEGGIVDSRRQDYMRIHTKRVLRELHEWKAWRAEDGEDGRVRQFESEKMGRRACRGKLQRGEREWGRITSRREKVVYTAGVVKEKNEGDRR